LPGTPFDMLFGPDEALWVSLPGQGVLARVQVAARMGPDADGGVPVVTQSPDDVAPPFLMDSAIENPKYFGVPKPTSFALGAPQDDGPPFVSYCGLGYDYTPNPLILPTAPRDTKVGAVAPSRLRYDQFSGLLFVADQNLPVLHVFSLGTDGTLTTRGALPVGATLKDFALTPLVPADSPALFTGAPISNPEGPQKRYLYGLETNGSLLAFELKTSETGASLVPLKAPVPDRFQDRLLMNSRVAVGAALEVIDTRPTSPENCGTGKNGVPVTVTPGDQTSIVTQLQRQFDQAKKDLTDAEKSGTDQQIADATRERDAAERRLEIAQLAGPRQLRGVFLTVISLAGEINVFDILDLDVDCRAETSCSQTSGDGQTNPLLEGSARQTGTEPAPVSVQRNAPRLVIGKEPEVQVSTVAAFQVPTCGPGYVAAVAPVTSDVENSQRLICVIADPWSQRDQNWTMATDATIPGLLMSGGVFEEAKDANGVVIEDQLILRAPAGISLCGRGAQDGQDDVVVVLDGSPANLADKCPTPTTGSETHLKILEAHDDYLVLRALARGTEDNIEALAELDDQLLDPGETLSTLRTQARDRANAEVDNLLFCFPEFVTFEVRTGNTLVRPDCPAEGECPANRAPRSPDGSQITNADQLAVQKNYLVTGTVSGYLHRTTVDAEGRCVEDTSKDPRYRARARPGQYFENTQVGFILSPEADTNVNLVTSQGSSVVREGIASVDLPAARPTSIRYFPYTNNLFVVDSATQGLRLMDLSPFSTDDDAVYR
jgi:hypothetical protein